MHRTRFQHGTPNVAIFGRRHPIACITQQFAQHGADEGSSSILITTGCAH
jgi:hypothetical protein